jgi:hypothetical protein
MYWASVRCAAPDHGGSNGAGRDYRKTAAFLSPLHDTIRHFLRDEAGRRILLARTGACSKRWTISALIKVTSTGCRGAISTCTNEKGPMGQNG